MDNNTTYCSVFNLDASEMIAYNNPLFPAHVRYGILSSYPDYSAVSHWHKECEFICILLSPELLSGNEWFYQNYIEPVIENSFYPYLYLGEMEWNNSILEKLDKLYSSFATQTEQELPYFTLIDQFLSIIKVLYKNLDIENHGKAKTSHELTSLRSMITYIEKHFTQRITLENIALSGACRRSRCSLLFKKYLHETPMTHIAKLRLRRNLTALLDSEKSITDIAYEYGFGGTSYYCETFRKYYGTSPLKYRKVQSE